MIDRLRKLSVYIQAQLSVLTVSQRVAIGLCAALVVGSLLWLVQWSTTPELVPVVNHEFTYDQLDAAEKALKADGVAYRIVGNRVYVPSADRPNALRLLHSSDSLPEGSLYDMQSVVTDPNPFQSPEARAYAQNYAKGNELAKIIATYPFVRKASVLVNPSMKRRLGGLGETPTASVAVTLATGTEMAPEIVDGFAKLVAGAVAGLKAQNVNVTDTRTGQSFNVPDPQDAAAFDYLAIAKKRESHLHTKIMSKLGDIPGLRATVTVELDTNKKVTTRLKHDSPQPKIETSQSSEQGSADQVAEPGVQANLGVAITANSAGQRSTTEETSVENYEPKLSEQETTEQAPFSTKRVTATVGIPRSFIVGIYKAKYPDAQEPKDDDPPFATVRDAEAARVKSSVEKIVMARSPNDIIVDVFPDMEWSATGGTWNRAPGGVATAFQAGTDAFDAIGLIRTYAGPAGLSLLALMSLFMLTRIAGKSATVISETTEFVDRDEMEQSEKVLATSRTTIGQAASSESFLTGREIDEETLRFQELGQEVSKMAEADPEGTAELIKQWIEEN